MNRVTFAATLKQTTDTRLLAVLKALMPGQRAALLANLRAGADLLDALRIAFTTPGAFPRVPSIAVVAVTTGLLVGRFHASKEEGAVAWAILLQEDADRRAILASFSVSYLGLRLLLTGATPTLAEVA